MGHLGARITEIAPARVRIVLRAVPKSPSSTATSTPAPPSAIADSAGGYAALTLFPENTEVRTVEYKINLLSPAVGDQAEAVGTVLRPGRTLSVCRLEVFGVQDGRPKLVAAGQQTLIRVGSPAA